MGASFRSVSQVLELAGCDLLTISPDLLQKLQDSEQSVARKLSPQAADDSLQRIDATEATFRYLLNENAMATEKLSEGIRQFCADAIKLEKMIAALR